MSLFDRFRAASKAFKGEKRGFLISPMGYGREYVKPDDMQSQVRAYLGWVYVAANKNAIAFSSVPLRLYVAKKAGAKMLVPTKAVSDRDKYRLAKSPTSAQSMAGADEVEEVTAHPFLDLMRKPNAYTTGNDLLFDIDLFQELTGNSYIYVFSDNIGPRSITSLPSQYMHVIPSPDKFIAGYKWMRDMQEVPFEADEVIHFRLPNPNNVYYGMSPLQAAKDAYNIAANMNIYQNAVFSNDGRLAGAFETDAQLNEDGFKRLKVQIDESFRGAKNAGKIPLLEAGLHYKDYGLAPRELDFLNSRKWSQEEIITAFGQTMALYDKQTTRANSETALYLWMAHTIAPRHRAVEARLNEELVRLYDENLFCAFDECVPENLDYQLTERKTHVELGITTINEERSKLGLEPVPWGDEPRKQAAPAPPAPAGEDEDDAEDAEKVEAPGGKSVKKKP